MKRRGENQHDGRRRREGGAGFLPWPLCLTSCVAMTLLKTAVSGSFSPMTLDRMSGDMMSCL